MLPRCTPYSTIQSKQKHQAVSFTCSEFISRRAFMQIGFDTQFDLVMFVFGFHITVLHMHPTRTCLGSWDSIEAKIIQYEEFSLCCLSALLSYRTVTDSFGFRDHVHDLHDLQVWYFNSAQYCIPTSAQLTAGERSCTRTSFVFMHGNIFTTVCLIGFIPSGSLLDSN